MAEQKTLPDTSSWPLLGETTNTTIYLVEPRIVALVAKPNTSDDLHTATENAAFHKRYFSENGRGVIIAFTDGGVSQNRDARRVYREELDDSVLLGVANTGGTALSRAFVALFLGFARPKIPFKMFSEIDEAMRWARDLVAEHADNDGSDDDAQSST